MLVYVESPALDEKESFSRCAIPHLMIQKQKGVKGVAQRNTMLSLYEGLNENGPYRLIESVIVRMCGLLK